MSAGLALLIGLVIISALAAYRVDLGPDKACDQHKWEYSDDTKRYTCAECGLVASDA